MNADDERDDRRPGDEPGQGAKLPKVGPQGPRVAPVRKPEPRAVRETKWLIGALREERGLAA